MEERNYGRLCQQSPMGTPMLMAIARVVRLSGRANHANFIGGHSVRVSILLTPATVARYFSTHTSCTYRAYVWVSRPDGKYNG